MRHDHDEPARHGLPEAVGWTMLLAQGVELAKASVSFPAGDDGDRWRESVAPLVEAQAVRHAISHLASLPIAERPLARDLAAVWIRRAASSLDSIWRGEPMPEVILEIVEAADEAVAHSVYAGLRMLRLSPNASPCWLPDDSGLEALAENPSGRSTAAAMAPGTLVLPGSPIAWWATREDPMIRESFRDVEIATAVRPVQVYREVDEQGRFGGDLVADLLELPAGMPLLVPRWLDGEPIGSPPIEASRWRQMQVVALGEREPRSLSLRWTEAARSGELEEAE
jgi:hypothetical protein